MSDTGFELSPIKAIELAAAKVPNAISLAQGIPSFSTPDVIKEYVKERISEGLCDKYSLTIGLAELREEIALSLAKDGVHYDPESEIIATAGSIEGLTASVVAVTSPGDEVIIPSPSYASYRGALAIARSQPVYVALDEDRNFDFEVDAIKRAITRKTRAILYCSPNNPTGTLYSEENTRRLMDLAVEHNLYIIVDEVYKDFYYTDDKHFSPVLIPEVRDRVIRVCSFSKSFAMTGWRIGFLHTDKTLMRSILKFHDAMVTCAPVVSQYAGIAALKFGEASLQGFIAEFRKRRDYALTVLDSLSSVLDYQLPKATYFVFPRIKDTVPLAGDSKRLAYDMLEKVALAVVPGSAFGPSGESHIRINFGRSEDVLKEGLSRLADYLTNSRRRIIQSGRGVHPAKAPVPLFKVLARRALAAAARLYLLRCKPKIVGIIGTKGKTVFKRVITDAIKERVSARASILSYNTEVGLPLSILNLHPPRGLGQKIQFACDLIQRALLSRDGARVLVLEYGLLSRDDALTLLSIAKPDWLVVTDLSAPVLSEENTGFYDGVKTMLMDSGSIPIIWADPDTNPDILGLRIEQGRLSLLSSPEGVGQDKNGISQSGQTTEGVTQSLAHAVWAANCLLNAMRIPPR